MTKPQKWKDELDGLFSTIHLFNLKIEVYLNPSDLCWHLECLGLSMKHISLPKEIDSLSLAKKEALIRIREKLLFFAEEASLLMLLGYP